MPSSRPGLDPCEVPLGNGDLLRTWDDDTETHVQLTSASRVELGHAVFSGRDSQEMAAVVVQRWISNHASEGWR